MRISGVSCHDPEPDEVRLIKLGHGRCCLAFGDVDVYGSLDTLAAVVQRASELVTRERGGIPRHDNGPTTIDVLGQAYDRNGNPISPKHETTS